MIINKVKKQSKKNPLKIAKTGLELETHVIKEDGSISYSGLSLIKDVKKTYPEVEIVKECGKNIIEFGTFPNINAFNPALELIKHVEKTIKVAKSKGLRLYPFSTYPYKIRTAFTSDPLGKYELQKHIFGAEKFGLATRVVGFHHHYTFPKGVFDNEKKKLRLFINSKLKRSLINSYNFEIAIDPILTLLTQSSPFANGQFLAKDSRMLLYRGGKKLGYNGMYNKLQQVGGLPPYKQTGSDLIISLNNRKKRWAKEIKKVDPTIRMKKIYPYDLDISWNPVKINKHGTLEQRGMDSNYLSILLGVSALIKFCLKKIQRDFIEVIPSDIGIKESFKLKKGIMFIPPHSYVRHILQKASAYEGFENDELYEYTKRFYNFAKSLSDEIYYPLFENIEEMIKKRRSVSDEIFNYAKRKGYLTKKGTISKRNSAKLALYLSQKFEKDLKKTKKIVKNISLAYDNKFDS